MIGLYIMTEKGYNVLATLTESFDTKIISYVVTERDPNIANDYFEEIKLLCKKYDVPLYKRNDIFLPAVKYKFAISWKWLIKDADNLIVLHDSILPKYRGFNPLVTALINGDNEIGVSAIFADKEADTGSIINIERIQIKYPIKINYAINLINQCYSKLMTDIVNKIIHKIPLSSVDQNNSDASFSLWRDEKDYHINWNDTAERIKRFIDSVGFPYKGAFAYVDKNKLIINDAELIEDMFIINRTPGKVIKLINGAPVIVCAVGLIHITCITDEDGNEYKIKNLRTRFV